MISRVFDSVPEDPPMNVRARPVSPTTVVVQWDEPKTPNGIVRVMMFTVYCNLRLNAVVVVVF